MTDVLARATVAAMLLGWLGFSIGIALRRRGPRGRVRRREWLSLGGIVLQMAGYAVAWSVQRTPSDRPLLGSGAGAQAVFFGLTVLLVGWAVWATVGAVRALGKHWSLQARVLEGHELVTSGPFRVVRHPIYSAMLALLVASGIAVGDWRRLLGGLAVTSLGTWLRVRGEERLLRENFGPAWDDYVERVPALLPRPPRAGSE